MTDDVSTDAGEFTGDDVFTETDESPDEWDIDVVVAEGRVEFVDLRIKPTLLAGFIDCLVDDVAESRAREILADAARKQGIELDDSEQ